MKANNLRIGQFVFLWLLALTAIASFINSGTHWTAPTPGDLPMGQIIGSFLLLVTQFFFALIGLILSIVGIVRAKDDSRERRTNWLFLGLFLVLPFVFWGIDSILLHIANNT